MAILAAGDIRKTRSQLCGVVFTLSELLLALLYITGICSALFATLQAACYALYACQPALSLCLKVLLWVEAVFSTLWTIVWLLEVIAVAYNMGVFYGCVSLCMYTDYGCREGRAAWVFGVICLSLWGVSTATAFLVIFQKAPQPGQEEPLIESGVADNEVQMTVEQA